ncbi:hypothetical protein [Bacillus sp. 165]|uniref:hypothetical protein n=1 Tax=Bacillus sp. 165 TaxID=1529117 RepID=UPI001ADB85FF|nr:hypothetical protein [Bacillus sp. 165]MBO9128386.1 hypothetical protein [Bacillus sp. 165]
MFFLPSSVNLNHIKINSMENNSTISTGSTIITNHNSKIQMNEGFGEQNADEVGMYIPILFVDDSDVIDHALTKKRYNPS